MTSDAGDFKYNDTTESSSSSSSTIVAPTPPLHLQIMAVPTKELKRRVLSLQKNSDRDDANNNSQQGPREFLKEHHQKCKVWIHCHLVHKFLSHHKNWEAEGRPCRLELGVLAPSEWTNRLWEFLRQIPPAAEHGDSDSQNNNNKKILSWPPTLKQRKGVQSSHYLTVRQQHPPHQDELWQLCRDVLMATLLRGDSVDESTTFQLPAYNALAITKNFLGSPHIDAHDQTFQHVIAVGDFTGGRLCCELDATQELQIDIHNRIGRMDGRHVHWVSGWQGKERYSVVYYSTRKEDWTDPATPQSEHVRWMQERIVELEKKKPNKQQ